MAHAQPIFVAGFESILIDEAADAAAAAAASSEAREHGAKAVTAILLAVAAVEAQLGVWSAIFASDYGIDRTTLKSWRRKGAHEIVKDILGRLEPPVAVPGVAWYNRLCAILALRNHAAHYFPEFRTPGTWPDELKGYVTNHTFSPIGDDTMDWTSRLLVAPVAKQVIGYAREVMDGFVQIAWRPP